MKTKIWVAWWNDLPAEEQALFAVLYFPGKKMFDIGITEVTFIYENEMCKFIKS